MSKNLVSFASVKRAVSLEAVLDRYGLLAGLARSGANLTGACPLCNGKSKRQFRVSTEKNAWYCFGCKEGGNVLDFVAKKEGLSLPAAARRLDHWFSLGLAAPETPSEKKTAAPAAAAADPDPLAPNEPLSFVLKTLDTKHSSLAALGLSEATIERFGLGFCTKGILKGCIAIPIHSRAGDLLAYAGLKPEVEGSERYRFPSKFHASLELFNLHRLPPQPVADGSIYLAAHLLGALRLCDAGHARVLSLFDGTLSEAQERILSALLPEGASVTVVSGAIDPAVLARLGALAPVRVAALDVLLNAPESAADSAEQLAS